MVVGIGGPSQSGKSTLANTLADWHIGSVSIIAQDDTIKEEKDIPKIKDRIDWESPLSIDDRQILGRLQKEIKTFDLVIVEGIFAFSFPEINDCYTHCIELNISKETFFSRRRKETRWGPEPHWYLEHVWKAYKRLKVEPPSPYIVVEDVHKSANLQQIKSFLEF